MITISNIKGFSRKGVRENNEDYVIYDDSVKTKVVVLCDGMGGHGHGEVASRTVAECVFYTLSRMKGDLTEEDLQHVLDEALEKLNRTDRYDDEKKMGTTLVVAVVNSNGVLVGHVGDSRCYLFDENGIRKFRTKDHSKVAEAVEAEILTEEEAINSQYKNLLTRCVMAGKTRVKIDVDRLEIQNNDRLLLCTDGVVDALRDDELSAILVDRNVDDALKIIESECERKSHDNYSAIIVELHKEEKNRTNHPNQNVYSYDDSKDMDNDQCKIERMRAELAYLKNKSRNNEFKVKALWFIIGFVLATLICGIASYLFLNRVYEQSQKEKEKHKNEMQNIYTTINMLSIPKDTTDTVVLRKNIMNYFKRTNSPQK